ncbi:MAG: hypothetical protein IJ935_14265 [Afipia sp.]|nr:hypothetical protein [Afipia sp.]
MLQTGHVALNVPRSADISLNDIDATYYWRSNAFGADKIRCTMIDDAIVPSSLRETGRPHEPAALPSVKSRRRTAHHLEPDGIAVVEHPQVARSRAKDQTLTTVRI